MSTIEDDDQEQGSDGETNHDGLSEPTLSCNSCRRRKLRCSKELPTCNPCNYESKRGKPASPQPQYIPLEADWIWLLDQLEKLVENQNSRGAQGNYHGQQTPTQNKDGGSPYELLSFFAREFQRFNDRDLAAQHPCSNGTWQRGDGAKRRRLDIGLAEEKADQADDARSAAKLNDDEVGLLVDAYFSCVHPWVPMVHEARFRRRLANPEQGRKLQIVIQAMALCAARYVEDIDLSKKLLSSQTQQHLKDSVIATAMKQLTVENSQALVILSFNEIGNGLASNVWSIIGALSRNVDYMQLATEHDEAERLRLSQPVASLPPAQDWTEEEERRRVFWNVFNLDRLCSVMTGWNTSLTSDDVNRRLPCDGIKWRKEDAVTTPYFGIWDKSAGRIGNPLTLLPAYYSQKATEAANATLSDGSPSPAAQQHAFEDLSTIGAFAYAVEATESLSRVTTYFLQQRVNMREHKEITSWLTRFKELDLRLVHWKMLLPHKWKVDVVHQHYPRMDPNLTLAHITHNASMILLHQLIAFPPREWAFRNRLPSTCSADTCHSAAVEISTITENYLRTAPSRMPLSSQFAFCLYIAARALLLHYRDADEAEPAPQFWSLTESLDAIGRRWAGQIANQSLQSMPNLAQKYSAKLAQMVAQLRQDPEFRLPVLAYTKEVDHSSESLLDVVVLDDADGSESNDASSSTIRVSQGTAPLPRNPETSITVGLADDAGPVPNASAGRQLSSNMQPVVPGSKRVPEPMYTPTMAAPGMEASMNPPDNVGRRSVDLGDISQLLLNQQFMELNRVISYDDGMFGTEFDGPPW
ncbi:putative transcriptional regulatory protein [Paramyrothecium foliicola]|nr:putative transcriptional regulatory protein [Paramyrothecium foliicola]